MLRKASALALLALTGCASKSPAAPTPLDRQLTMAAGETRQLSEGVSLRFIGVPADSRCPGDAICVWAGDATVRVEVNSNRSIAERELHTASNQPVFHDGLTISLVSLDPYPFHTRPIQPGDYRATVRVRR
jgi:hypothetical protein